MARKTAGAQAAVAVVQPMDLEREFAERLFHTIGASIRNKDRRRLEMINDVQVRGADSAVRYSGAALKSEVSADMAEEMWKELVRAGVQTPGEAVAVIERLVVLWTGTLIREAGQMQASDYLTHAVQQVRAKAMSEFIRYDLMQGLVEWWQTQF